MYAMLLAAGLSSRLAGLSAERPKPLLPVCNVPLLRWVAALAIHHGLRDLVVNLHHLGELVRAELGDGSAIGANVRYSEEPEILGTGGGIKAMARLMPRQTCVAINAKIVTDVDLGEVLAFHRRRGALATLVLHPHPQAERWGAVGVDAEGGLVRLLEARRQGAGPGTDCLFTGIHVLEPELIDAIPEGPCCIVRTAYARLFAAGAPLAGFVHHGYFYDHSTPARYLQGNFNLLEGKVDPPARPGPLSGVESGAIVHPTARLSAPVLVGTGALVEQDVVIGPRTVIGPGARVVAGSSLREVVAWPGASVSGELRRAVIASSGLVLQVPDEGDPARGPR